MKRVSVGERNIKLFLETVVCIVITETVTPIITTETVLCIMHCRKYHLHKARTSKITIKIVTHIFAAETATCISEAETSNYIIATETVTCIIATEPQNLHNCKRRHLHNCYRKLHSSKRNCHCRIDHPSLHLPAQS